MRQPGGSRPECGTPHPQRRSTSEVGLVSHSQLRHRRTVSRQRHGARDDRLMHTSETSGARVGSVQRLGPGWFSLLGSTVQTPADPSSRMASGS